MPLRPLPLLLRAFEAAVCQAVKCFKCSRGSVDQGPGTQATASLLLRAYRRLPFASPQMPQMLSRQLRPGTQATASLLVRRSRLPFARPEMPHMLSRQRSTKHSGHCLSVVIGRSRLPFASPQMPQMLSRQLRPATQATASLLLRAFEAAVCQAVTCFKCSRGSFDQALIATAVCYYRAFEAAVCEPANASQRSHGSFDQALRPLSHLLLIGVRGCRLPRPSNASNVLTAASTSHSRPHCLSVTIRAFEAAVCQALRMPQMPSAAASTRHSLTLATAICFLGCAWTRLRPQPSAIKGLRKCTGKCSIFLFHFLFLSLPLCLGNVLMFFLASFSRRRVLCDRNAPKRLR